ncbi:MAG: hypothetical protein GY903_10460 [Fuerstiella sp.]|nr:hypothetical protein [Fuerstiella sp.]MCP4854900.1 hypothetical protein [Fuerstiella sp.]
MNSRWLIVVTLLLLAGATGCSRFRELSRRDYALLRDPFIGRLGAEDEVTDSVAPSDGGTGRISIHDTATAAADYGAAGEFDASDVPVEPTADDTRLKEIRSRGAVGEIAATSGPSLSDFIGQRPDVAQTASLPSLKYPGAGTTRSGFAPFAEPSPGVAANEDFSVWAASQNEEWNSTAGQSASPRIRQVSQTLNTTVLGDDDLPTLPSLDSDSSQPVVPETATPLIRAATRNSASPAQAMATHPPIGGGDPFATKPQEINTRTLPQPHVPIQSPPQPLVFDTPTAASPIGSNPFVESEEPKRPAVDPFAAAAAERKASLHAPVDSTFRFDTGWKPSNLVRP